MTLTPFAWSSLSHLQLGRYAEYFVKLELTLYGFQVFTSEVDDRALTLWRGAKTASSTKSK